jgi:hypothetical protein
MAGETRGELAEAITNFAVRQAVLGIDKSLSVYWEEKPSTIPVIPDITVGLSAELPKIIILVTACDAPKNYAEKFWRNTGEQFDAKTRINPRPLVINIVYLSKIKPELVRFTESISDDTILIDRIPETQIEIPRFLDDVTPDAPEKRADKAQLVANAYNKDTKDYREGFARSMRHLICILRERFRSTLEKHADLWTLMSSDFAVRGHNTRTVKKRRFRFSGGICDSFV